jgi:regulator of sigma E protease
VGDIVKTVNKKEITKADDFINIINENKGKKVQLTIERKINETSQEKKLTLTPRENPPEGEGALGVAITSKAIETYYPPLWQRPFVGLKEGVKQTLNFTQAVFGGIAQMATDAGQGKAPKSLCGPFCIVAVFADQIKTGFVNFISFVGVVSLNLAVLNLIPFPPLDGSRVLFVILEKFVSKKKLPKIESYSYTVGFILLLSLVALITLREIPKLIQAGSLSGFVDVLIQQ